MNQYEERLNRIKAAIALEPTDKIPMLSSGPAAYAAFAGVPLGDYIADMELNCDVNLKMCQEFDVDGTQAPIFSPYLLPMLWFSQVKVPGVELDKDALWQIHERELMKHSDYDFIIEHGYGEWQAKFLNREFDHPFEKAMPYFEYMPEAIRRYTEAGIPILVGDTLESPFESLCGGRSLGCFLADDLMEIPETVDKVFQIVHEYNIAQYRSRMENPATRPLGVWVGGWRGTPSMLSAPMFEKYSWNYFKELVELCLEFDVIPILHLDSDWTLGLKYFKELPPKRAIMALDGKTDIYKAKEILGDTICIMGDVPAEMLAFGKPENVYQYCMKLIRDIGPCGYILCSGCDIPFNAKIENVKMMQKAVEDSRK